MKSMFVFLMLICAGFAHAEIYTFNVPMTCEHCSNAISKALNKKFGDQITTNIDVEKNKVVVDTNKNAIEPEAIMAPIEYLGFKAKLISTIPSQKTTETLF